LIIGISRLLWCTGIGCRPTLQSAVSGMGRDIPRSLFLRPQSLDRQVLVRNADGQLAPATKRSQPTLAALTRCRFASTKILAPTSCGLNLSSPWGYTVVVPKHQYRPAHNENNLRPPTLVSFSKTVISPKTSFPTRSRITLPARLKNQAAALPLAPAPMIATRLGSS
jgi:hypothetical protein